MVACFGAEILTVAAFPRPDRIASPLISCKEHAALLVLAALVWSGICTLICIARRRCSMADKPADKQAIKGLEPDGQQHDLPLEEPPPGTNDPGGAHTKGYSADPRPEKGVKREGPIPLAAVPEDGSHVRQPELEGKVRPTGRSEPHEYTPNDRLMGSDR
jgi:hypothetical protein